MAQFNGTVKQLENSVAQTEATADYVISRTTQTVEIKENSANGSITWDVETWASGKVVLNCHDTVKSVADPAAVYSTKCVMPVTMKDTNYFIYVNPKKFSRASTGTALPSVFPYYQKTEALFWIGSNTASLDYNCIVIGYIDV